MTQSTETRLTKAQEAALIEWLYENGPRRNHCNGKTYGHHYEPTLTTLDSLVRHGLAKKVPCDVALSNCYALTDAGRAARAALASVEA